MKKTDVPFAPFQAALTIAALAALLIGLGFLMGGCADAHTLAALTFRDGANAVKDSYRAARIAEMDEAAERARAQGADDEAVEVAVRRVGSDFDERHARLRRAQRLLANASTAYTRAARAAFIGQGDGGDDLDAMRSAAEAALRDALALMVADGIPETSGGDDGDDDE